MARILICDDAPFMRELLRDILTNGGHEVVGEAKDVDEAVGLFSKTKPDLVTMDILMGMSGTVAIERIREVDAKARIIVVTVLTARDKEVVEAIKDGAIGIVQKPIRKEVMLAEVERVLKK